MRPLTNVSASNERKPGPNFSDGQNKWTGNSTHVGIMTQADLNHVGMQLEAKTKARGAHLYCVLAMHMGSLPYPLPVYLHKSSKHEERNQRQKEE
jgi:hypothetical protein